MKVAILGGGGAMGGLFGGYLSSAGHDVTLVDVSTAAIEAINSNGLKIEEKDGSIITATPRSTSDTASIGKVDLIVNFVKCYHTESALKSALPMIGPDTVVLSLQNGWGNAARIAAVTGDAQLLVGLTYHSATLIAPGHVKHPGVGATYMGELNGALSPRLHNVAEAFRGAGFETNEMPNILDEVWKKLALNVCTLPTAGLLRFTANTLGEHKGTVALMRGLLEETVAVARAQGIALDLEERWSAITGLLSRAIGARASMLQDVDAKRRTEIEVINGAIVDAGVRLGIATPYNNSMVWLIDSLQDAYMAEATKASA